MIERNLSPDEIKGMSSSEVTQRMEEVQNALLQLQLSLKQSQGKEPAGSGLSWRDAVLQAIQRLVQRTGQRKFSYSKLRKEELPIILEQTGSRCHVPQNYMRNIIKNILVRDRVVELTEDGLFVYVGTLDQ